MVSRYAPDVAPGPRVPVHHDEVPHPNVYEIDPQPRLTGGQRAVVLVGGVVLVAFWWFVLRAVLGLF